MRNYLIEDKNMIFSKNCGIATVRLKDKYQRNGNVWLFGGSGTGKTRYYMLPNILQFNSDIVCTDPKGTLVEQCGYALVGAGYDVRCFDVFQFYKSMHYNPLRYVKTDADILKFVKFIIKNTKGEDGRGGASDPFWEDSESLFYTALIAYLRDWCDPTDYTLDGLLKLLSFAKAKDEDEDWKSPLDFIFEEIRLGRIPSSSDGAKDDAYREKNRDWATPKKRMMERSVLYNRTTNFVPYDEYCLLRIESEKDAMGQSAFMQWLLGKGHSDEESYLRYLKAQDFAPEDDITIPVNKDYALRNYEAFKTAAGKTLKSIIISCNVRLAPLATAELRELLTFDEMHFEDLGAPDKKTAIFAIMEDTDDAYSFMVAMLMWQMMNFCCGLALTKYGGSFPRPVNVLYDEFGNLGVLVGIHKICSVIRSRNIHMTAAIQSYYQLKKTYDEETAQIISACCDARLFIGGGDEHTLDEWSKALGKATIQTIEYSAQKGGQAHLTKSYRKVARELMLPDEIKRLPNDECLVEIRGAYPWKDKKYVLKNHPNYNWLYEKGNKRAYYQEPFDIRAWRRSPEVAGLPESSRQELEFSDEDTGLDDSAVVIVDEQGTEQEIEIRNSPFSYGERDFEELLYRIENGLYETAGRTEVAGGEPESKDDYPEFIGTDWGGETGERVA
jgi:type IV secretion system protein VirD4